MYFYWIWFYYWVCVLVWLFSYHFAEVGKTIVFFSHSVVEVEVRCCSPPLDFDVYLWYHSIASLLRNIYGFS